MRNPYRRFVSGYLHAARAAERKARGNRPRRAAEQPPVIGTLDEYAELCVELLGDTRGLWGREALAFRRAHAERRYGPLGIRLRHLGFVSGHARPQVDFLPDCNPERLFGVPRRRPARALFFGVVETRGARSADRGSVRTAACNRSAQRLDEGVVSGLARPGAPPRGAVSRSRRARRPPPDRAAGTLSGALVIQHCADPAPPTGRLSAGLASRRQRLIFPGDCPDADIGSGVGALVDRRRVSGAVSEPASALPISGRGTFARFDGLRPGSGSRPGGVPAQGLAAGSAPRASAVARLRSRTMRLTLRA